MGMQELFRGYVAVVWEGTNLNSKKYRTLNKIVPKKCIEFYMKCQKERNEAYHDECKQRQRITEWYKKVKNSAENSNKNQMRMYVKKYKINVQQYTLGTIKRQINNIKEFERKIEKIPQNNIRRYFMI